MAKVIKSALFAVSKNSSASWTNVGSSCRSVSSMVHLNTAAPLTSSTTSLARTHSTLSKICQQGCKGCLACSTRQRFSAPRYSTEVDKELSSFLEKEIQFEGSRTSDRLPKIPGFEIKTDGASVTLSKNMNSETVVIKLSVIGCVDAVPSESGATPSEDDPPKMECRPPFEVEISKGSGQVVALRCTFPHPEEMPIEDGQAAEEGQTEDQFAIEEVAIHDGELKETTMAVSGDTMDVELHDLLMDMLDERGVNDQFICQLVDFCTAYENSLYINLLKSLKNFADK